MRILYRFKDGIVIDTKEMGEITTEGQGDFLKMLQDLKKDPNAVVELEGKIVKPFSELYSVEIILE